MSLQDCDARIKMCCWKFMCEYSSIHREMRDAANVAMIAASVKPEVEKFPHMQSLRVSYHELANYS